MAPRGAIFFIVFLFPSDVCREAVVEMMFLVNTVFFLLDYLPIAFCELWEECVRLLWSVVNFREAQNVGFRE